MSRTRHDSQRIPSGTKKAILRKHYRRRVRYSRDWENWDEYLHPVCIHNMYWRHYS